MIQKKKLYLPTLPTGGHVPQEGVALALKIGGQNCHFYQFEYSATMIIYGKK